VKAGLPPVAAKVFETAALGANSPSAPGVVMVSGPKLMVTVYWSVAGVALGLRASLNVTLSVRFPPPVGLPLIAPVLALTVRPEIPLIAQL
jgi:hypothetical protein